MFQMQSIKYIVLYCILCIVDIQRSLLIDFCKRLSLIVRSEFPVNNIEIDSETTYNNPSLFFIRDIGDLGMISKEWRKISVKLRHFICYVFIDYLFSLGENVILCRFI